MSHAVKQQKFPVSTPHSSGVAKREFQRQLQILTADLPDENPKRIDKIFTDAALRFRKSTGSVTIIYRNNKN